MAQCRRRYRQNQMTSADPEFTAASANLKIDARSLPNSALPVTSSPAPTSQQDQSGQGSGQRELPPRTAPARRKAKPKALLAAARRAV